MILPKHFNEIRRSARREPVVGIVAVLQGIEQAEGIEDVGRRPCEMISVILLLQSSDGFFASYLPSLGEVIEIVGHLRQHLLLGYAAYSGIVGAHGYVLEVVQLAEDAELRKLRYAGEEDKLQIRVTVFQRRIEIAHNIAEHRQCRVFMNNVEQRGVILVDKYNDFLACLLVCSLNQCRETVVDISCRLCNAIFTLIFCKAITKIAFQLILLHVLARCHTDAQHGVFRPILLHSFDEDPLEQVPSSLEICL